MHTIPIKTRCLEVTDELIKNKPEFTQVAYEEIYVETNQHDKEIGISSNVIFPQKGDLITESGHVIKNEHVYSLKEIKGEEFIITKELGYFNKLEERRLHNIEQSLPANQEIGFNKILIAMKIQKIRDNAMKNDRPLSNQDDKPKLN